MEHAKILRTEVVPIQLVSRHPENARKGDSKRIEASLRNFGQYAPVIVHQQSGYIVKGNNTHRIMVDVLGRAEILATFISCTEGQARAILAADNRTTDDAGYDELALLALLETLNAAGDLFTAGYNQADITELSALLEPELDPELLAIDEEDEGAPSHIATAAGAETGSPAEHVRAYDRRASRALHLIMPLARYTWALEHLDGLQAEYKEDNFGDVLLRMISELTGEEIPDA